MTVHDLVSVFASHAALRVLWAFLSVGMVKGCLLVLAAWLLCRLCCAGQPSRAHLVWLAALAGLVALPLAWLAAPPIQVPPILARAASAVGTPLPLLPLSADHLLGLTGTASGYTALARQSLPGRVPPAAWFVLAAWGTGVAFLLLRAAVGRLTVRRGACGRPIPPAAARLASDLCHELALPRTVRFFASPRCAVPYTFGLLRPVVVVPAGAAAWPAARLRPVLLHELGHVKRRDALFNGLATLVTSLLWCFPPAWVASRFLSRAKELACDRLVLEHGVTAHRYASEMLELVRRSRGNLLVPAGGSSFGTQGMVRERIVAVLKAGKLVAARKAGLAALCIFCCLLPLMAVRLTAAPGAGIQRLIGTWTNTQYFGTYWTHSYTMGRGAKMTWNDFSNDEVPTGEARYLIDRQWEDSRGAAWYFITAKSSYLPYNEEVASATLSYSLMRVDPSGDRLDMETSLMSWPQEFGALGNFHYVYYRKQ